MAVLTQNVTSYYRGTIFFNFAQSGWSETLDMIGSNDADALGQLTKYLNHRRWMLPLSVSAVYGRVVKVPLARYSVALGGLPLVGRAPSLTAPNANDMNDPDASFCGHFIADEGKASIRFFRGLPDDAIAGNAIVPAAPGGSWFDVSVDPGDGTATPATLAAAIKNCFSFLGYYTYVASQQQTLVIGGVPTLGYRMRIMTNFLSRSVRNKKTGRPFGLSRGRALIH
jgi:hypothetical protein